MMEVWKEWIMGKIEIPGGFEDGCAIAIKFDQEIWLIGGFRPGKRILSFDVESHTFKVLPFSAILMLLLSKSEFWHYLFF